MSRAVILMYHIIDDPRSSMEARYACSPRRFKAQLQRIQADGYAFMPLADLALGLAGEGPPLREGSVAVTLDDGFSDTCTQALPILDSLNIPATVFVTTGTIGGENVWMTPPRGYPPRRMLSWDDVRTLQRAGMGIGSHTLTHPRLSTLPPGRLQVELKDSRATLENKLGAPVREIAYPYGDFSPAVMAAAAVVGYAIGCTTRCGFNRPGIALLELRRIEVYGSDAPWRLAQKVRFGANDSSVLKPAFYYARRAADRLRATIA
jgi:peptidoglycan/xylan/chitin deacetylase (PgdA/CDA1 family)